jgi:hypothetical protein
MAVRTLVLAMLCVSCAPQLPEVAPPTAPGEPRLGGSAALPEDAPRGWLIPADSVAKLYAFTNAVWTNPRVSGPYPRNIIHLFFHPTATRNQRQSAIEAVEGRVIGGGGVFYYVLVPTTTGDALWASIDRLAALPQVSLALPDLLTWGITSHSRRRPDGGVNPVPEVPPTGWLIPGDSVEKLYAFTNAIWTHPRLSGPYPRNIIEVFFTRSATREERQLALDMVDGRVIGGGGVYYYVLVPTATGDQLWASIDRLKALPYVTRAAPDILTQGTIPMTAPAP